MKARNIPFYVTLLACLLPPVAAYLNAKAVTYIPELVLAIGYICFLAAAVQRKISLGIGLGWFFLLIFIFLHAMVQLFAFGGHGSMGSVSVIVTTVIFLQLLNEPAVANTPARIAKQLGVLYALQIVVLFAELGLRVAGFSETLVHLFGEANVVTRYKDYNSATFLWYIGFNESFWGLNGLLLGSQSAGQVMLCATALFAPIYHHSLLRGAKYSFLFLAAIAGFLCAINMTSALIGAFIVFLLIYLVPQSRLGNWFMRVSAPIILILFAAQIGRLLTFRIQSERDLEIYLDAYMPPLQALLDMSWFERLFGLGRYEVRAEFSDFGLAMLLNQVGLVLVLSLAAGVAVIIFRAFIEVIKARRVRHSGNARTEQESWVWLATVNSLLVTIWVVSLIHYTPAIELGGRQLLALHCAVTCVATARLREMRKQRMKTPQGSPGEELMLPDLHRGNGLGTK